MGPIGWECCLAGVHTAAGHDGSYGYRPKRTAAQAVDRVAEAMSVARTTFSARLARYLSRRWGPALAARGGRIPGKKRAIVAVARKLAVLLHRLWLTGDPYRPLRDGPPVALTPA
jgi:hypothetical protein